MRQAKRASLRVKLLVSYSDILRNTRRVVKGLKTGQIFSIMIIGDNGGDLRLCEAAEQTGRSQQAVFNRFSRTMKDGFIYKSNKRYYLTDSGRLAYNAVCAQFDKTMNEIIDELKHEAISRAKLD